MSRSREVSTRRGGPCVAASLAAFALIVPCFAQAQSSLLAGTRLELSADHHSDPLALNQFGSDDLDKATPRPGRNLAYVRDELRLSTDFAGGRLALLARQSATGVASPGAVHLTAAVSSKGSPAADANYAVHLRFIGFAGAGLAWHTGDMPRVDLAEAEGPGPLLPAAGWHWQAGAQGLVLKRLVWRRIEGQASFASATESYAANLASDRADDRLSFPFQHDFATQGYALLLQAQLWWCGESSCFGGGVRDWGRLWWHGLPREQEVLSSDTQRYDSDGYVIYKPLLQGHNSQPSDVQGSPATFNLDARWAIAANWQAGVRGEWLQTYGWLPSLRLQWAGPAGIRWTGSWQLHERRVGLQAAGERWRIRLATDRFGAGSHSQALSLAWQWPL